MSWFIEMPLRIRAAGWSEKIYLIYDLFLISSSRVEVLRSRTYAIQNLEPSLRPLVQLPPGNEDGELCVGRATNLKK